MRRILTSLWAARVARHSDQPFTRELGQHRLQYEPRGSTLVVSFDKAARPEQEPYEGRETWGAEFYRAEGHSILGVIAREASWYRDPLLIAALEDLKNQGFFAAFDRVVMTGGSMGGFAAAAFAPLAPGAIVIAFSPQSTLNKDLAPWEWRYPKGRARDWTLPYGDAVDGLDAVRACYVLYDGLDRPDCRHAARFGTASRVVLLQIPGGGHGVSRLLSEMKVLKPLTRGMVDLSMSPAKFRSMARIRKTSLHYHRVMANHAMVRQRFALAQRICDTALRQFPQSDLSAIRMRASEAQARHDQAPHAAPASPVQRKTLELTMTTDQIHRLNARFPQLKRNIFIVTYGRTGSTLLQGLIQTLPGCTMLGENHNAIESIWHAATRARMARTTWGGEARTEDHPWHGADRIRPALFAAGMIDSMIDHVLCPPKDARYFGFKEIRYNSLGDKFPELLDFIRFHFKDAFFVFNTRNVDDVAKSAWWKDWKTADVHTLVHTMDRRFADYHASYPKDSIILSYEQFSTDPMALKPLFDRLNEPFDQARITAVLGKRLTH